MCCPEKDCLKFTIFGINVVFFLFGVVVAALGIASVVANDFFRVASILMTTVGVLMILTTFLGCCGAARESKCVLIMYIVALVILVLLQAVFIYLCFSVNESKISTYMRNSFDKDKDLFHKRADSLECCGVDGIEDYHQTYVPKVCCATEVKEMCTELGCGCPPSDVRIGCTKRAVEILQKSKKPLAYIVIGVCVFEVLLAIGSAVIVTLSKKGVKFGNYN